MATAEAPAAPAAAAAAGAQLQSSTTQQQQSQQSQQAGAGSANRILFLVVVSGADLDCLEDPKPSGPRYTRDSLRNLLQLLGCKPRLAVKVMVAVFQAVDTAVTTARQQRISRKTFQVHPHRNGKVYVSLTRADFMSLVSSCAAQYSYKISPSSEELKVACSLRERRRCVVVLLCGTSGSGKSTLASILASRLGITTVVSTDSIRHMMRSFISQEQSPLLWASTYQAGEHLGDSDKAQKASSESELAVYGYKAQCALLSEHLELLIAGCEARTQSLICEGVHLNISSVAKLMARHPSVLPFLVYIPSESRHVERMAVRAKYMTLDPNKNRYVRYMGNIRLIQEYLVRKADKYAVPRVDNSNVDRSVGIIHLTVMSCLRRMARGEPVLDPATGRTSMLAAEYAAVLDHLQGEKERLTAATAAAHASSSSSATTQQPSQTPLLQQQVQQPQHPSVAGVSLQQHEAGGSSSGSSRGASAAAQDRQQQAGSRGTFSQQPPPPTAAPTGGAPVETPGSNGAGAIKQGGAPAAGVGQQGPAGAAAAGDGPGVTASGPVGRQHQQLHQSHGGTSVAPTQCGEHHQLPATSSSGSLAAAAPGSCSAAAPGSTVGSAGQAGGMQQGMWRQDQQQQQEQQLRAAPAPGARSPAPEGVNGGVLDAPTQAHAAEQQAGITACQHAQQQQPHPTGTQQQPAPASNGNGRSSSSSGGGESAAASRGTAHTAEPGTASSSGTGMQLPGRPSSSRDAAGAGISRGSFDQQGQQQQHLQSRVQQQQPEQQQQQQNGGQQQQQQAAECEGESDAELVSSGEELDGLGELGSSDNEGERFLQEYGSVYESTTCDEHDDYDEAGGLRAWHTGMATALWPSYSHVYAPGAAAANGPGGLVLPAGAGTAGVLLPAAARAGAGSRVLRASQSEFGGAASGTATAVSNSSSNAGARGVQQGPASSSTGPGVLVPGVAPPSAPSRPYALPTVYEGQQPQQQRRGQEGLGRPPLPAAAGGVSSLDAASSSARAAAAAASRGGMGRHAPRSSSLHHSGRHRPRSAGSNSGGSSSAAAAGGAPVMLRQWSADVQGRVSSPDPRPPSPPALVVAEQQPTAEADAAVNPTP